MSIYNGPPRGGTRGGRDQFSWDQVKSDKDREYYLGHSVKALAGRWQKGWLYAGTFSMVVRDYFVATIHTHVLCSPGKDVYWYTREKDEGGGVSSNEFQAIKAKEEELMMQVC